MPHFLRKGSAFYISFNSTCGYAAEVDKAMPGHRTPHLAFRTSLDWAIDFEPVLPSTLERFDPLKPILQEYFCSS